MAKKRGNGEGSITQLKDGRWQGRYTLTTSEGPKRKAVYGKTREEVRKKLAKAIADRDSGYVFDAQNQTVGDYLERWLKDSVEKNVSHRTFHNYRSQIHNHLVPALGRIKLKSLNAANIQSLYRSKLENLSPSSVRYIHAVLHRALEQAVKWNLISHNVAKAVDLPKIVREEVEAFSPEEAKRFLEEARGDRLEALYVLAIHCGLRQGELLGLKWEDIDLASGTLQVTRQLQRKRDGGGLAFLPLKTEKARRTIRLNSPVIESLKAHRTRQVEEKLQLGALYQDWGLVFASLQGTPLDAQNVVNRSFKPLLSRAGVTNIKFHGLRHSCATVLLDQEIHEKFVQELLGHSSSTITLDVYSHMQSHMGDKVAFAMEKALS